MGDVFCLVRLMGFPPPPCGLAAILLFIMRQRLAILVRCGPTDPLLCTMSNQSVGALHSSDSSSHQMAKDVKAGCDPKLTAEPGSGAAIGLSDQDFAKLVKAVTGLSSFVRLPLSLLSNRMLNELSGTASGPGRTRSIR